MISPVAIGVNGWNDMATLMPLAALLSRAGKYIGLKKQNYHVVVHQNGSSFTLNFLKIFLTFGRYIMKDFCCWRFPCEPNTQ
jgi:hypothetical protein